MNVNNLNRKQEIRLNKVSNDLEEQLWVQQLDVRLRDVNLLIWLSHHSLCGNTLSLLIGICLLLVVLPDTIEE